MQNNSSIDLYKAVKENNKRKFLDIIFEKDNSFTFDLNYQAEVSIYNLRIYLSKQQL